MTGGSLTTTPEDQEPFPTLAAATNAVARAHDIFAREAARPPDDLEEPLWYRDEQGTTLMVPRWLALRHVANQASYHRGQLVASLQHAELTPPPTDFIQWALERQSV